MSALEPVYARTLVGIGDTHMYALTSPEKKAFATNRAQKFQDRILAMPTPAGVFQIGDLTEMGRPDEAAVAEPWWEAWDPIPKVICPGNHDINNGVDVDAVECDDLPDFEARYGDRTQVLDTEFFRVVSCLWTNNYWDGTQFVDQPGPAEGLNTAAGYALIRDLILASEKPTALGFHFTLRGPPTVPGPNAGNSYSGAITAAAEANVKALIANCPNLQLILTGHTHTPPWYTSPWWLGKYPGSNGRLVEHFNLSATTYQGSFGDTRSPVRAYVFTFHEEHFEFRCRDVENDAWVPRWVGFPRVERYEYT